MEVVDCTNCHSSQKQPVYELADFWQKQAGTFVLNKCLHCGLLYLSPRPTEAEIGRYYPDEYAPFATQPASRWQRWNRQLGLRKRTRLIERYQPKKGHALDVGCATGDFLLALQQEGWHVQGVELTPSAAHYAREQHGLTVADGSLESADFAEQQFDLITMWHVLEHVYDPEQTLRETARIARPDALLLLAVPDPESWEARIFGRSWAGWDAPRHLHLFRLSHLQAKLTEIGWDPIATHYMDGRHVLFALSCRHWLDNHRLPNWFKTISNRIIGSVFARILLLPYFWLIERLGKGSIMVILARRTA